MTRQQHHFFSTGRKKYNTRIICFSFFLLTFPSCGLLNIHTKIALFRENMFYNVWPAKARFNNASALFDAKHSFHFEASLNPCFLNVSYYRELVEPRIQVFSWSGLSNSLKLFGNIANCSKTVLLLSVFIMFLFILRLYVINSVSKFFAGDCDFPQ